MLGLCRLHTESLRILLLQGLRCRDTHGSDKNWLRRPQGGQPRGAAHAQFCLLGETMLGQDPPPLSLMKVADPARSNILWRLNAVFCSSHIIMQWWILCSRHLKRWRFLGCFRTCSVVRLILTNSLRRLVCVFFEWLRRLRRLRRLLAILSDCSFDRFLLFFDIWKKHNWQPESHLLPQWGGIHSYLGSNESVQQITKQKLHQWTAA